MKSCALCQGRFPATDLNRISGLDFCSTCSLYEPEGELPSVGITVARKHSRIRSEHGVWYEVMLTMHGASPDLKRLSWSFKREFLFQRVRNQVFGELKVGDPLFDRLVSIEKMPPDDLALLSENEGLQSAILSMVSSMEESTNVVEIRSGQVKWSFNRRLPYTPEEWRMAQFESLALGIHLHRLFERG